MVILLFIDSSATFISFPLLEGSQPELFFKSLTGWESYPRYRSAYFVNAPLVL